MEHYVGDAFRIEGTFFRVTGKVQYQNLETQEKWYEYYVFAPETGQRALYSCGIYKKENWLIEKEDKISLDDVYFVEQEVTEVIAARGTVDLQVGERGVLKKYQDAFGKTVKIVRTWNDEDSFYCGYCEGAMENPFTEDIHAGKKKRKRKRGFRNTERTPAQESMFRFRIILSILAVVITTLCSIWNFMNVPSAMKYIEENNLKYIHLRSLITDNQDFADVYMSSDSLDNTAIELIECIDGKAEEIQQNLDNGDRSIAILTNKEYCFIYESVENQVLVQISPRKYAYSSDYALFQGTEYATEYYKHFYYTWGYSSDRKKYPEVTSPYLTYANRVLNINNRDKYSEYADKVWRRKRRRSIFSNY